jgi:Cu(I)/Ag(I) efflux system periplasmic protein CusF
MKFPLSLVACATLFALSTPLVLAADHAAHMQAAAPAAAFPLSEGVVKKVDKAGGKFTITHGPLENLGMPGMTMAFVAQDKTWLDRYKVGDKVRFRVEDAQGIYTIVRIEAAP